MPRRRPLVPADHCDRTAGSELGAARGGIWLDGRPWCGVLAWTVRWAARAGLATLIGWAAVRAQEPLNLPAPLAKPTVPTLSAGQVALSLSAAERAQDLGFPSIATGLYRQLLDAPGTDRPAIALSLATALLELGDGAGAEQILNGFSGPRTAAWHLRAGLTAAQLKKFDVARAEEMSVKGDELSAADRAWYFYLVAVIAEAAPDVARANDFYLQAERAATSEFARVRFQIARQRSRVQLHGSVTRDPRELRDLADEARRVYERTQGREPGYESARNYAVLLETLKRHDEAVLFLQNVLAALPAEERARSDDFRLILGFIADPSRELPGRTALTQLLETGADRERQRMALQLLADAAAKSDLLRGWFRTELDKLIAANPPHPILPSLLLFRAQVALATKDSGSYAQAEKDAQRLLASVQDQALRLQAYGVLTASAWEQRRYRTAANYAQKARTELIAATGVDEAATRYRFSVLEAEARFRAGVNTLGDASDFRSAADAYGTVMHERGVALKPGEYSSFMFQRVLAEIRAGAPEAAEPILDDFARDPSLQSPEDLENRWQAEWNLARALQVVGKTTEAYTRVNQLLAPGALNNAALNPELRARMAWLQAHLSLEADEPERTLQLVDALAALPAGLDPGLKTEISSTGALLKAMAQFRLGETERLNQRAAETKGETAKVTQFAAKAKAYEDSAIDALKKVRAEFDKSDATVKSYIVEADFYASPGQDRLVDAQNQLIKLADDFPGNTYAPYALYRAALQAERLGQQKNFEEANLIIERLVTKYPQSDLVFDARFLQGDLARKLNLFPRAQLAYEDLINRYPQRDDLVLVRLALAASLNAQASADPTKGEQALETYAAVRDRADDRYLDARVEAGFNYGLLLKQRGQPDKALEAWWRDVVQQFLPGGKDLAGTTKVFDEHPKTRYWMARTLIELGDLQEQLKNFEQAKNAWDLVLKLHLPGDAQAKERLKRYGVPEAAP